MKLLDVDSKTDLKDEIIVEVENSTNQVPQRRKRC